MSPQLGQSASSAVDRKTHLWRLFHRLLHLMPRGHYWVKWNTGSPNESDLATYSSISRSRITVNWINARRFSLPDMNGLYQRFCHWDLFWMQFFNCFAIGFYMRVSTCSDLVQAAPCVNLRTPRPRKWVTYYSSRIYRVPSELSQYKTNL